LALGLRFVAGYLAAFLRGRIALRRERNAGRMTLGSGRRRQLVVLALVPDLTHPTDIKPNLETPLR